MSRELFWTNVVQRMGYMPMTALADKIGVSYNTVCSWKSKNKVPDGITCIKIAEAVGCELKELFTEEVPA